MKKIFKIIGFSLFALGALFAIIGSIFLINFINFEKKAVEISATITDITSYRDVDGDTSYDVYITYTYNNQDYTVDFNYYSSFMEVGNVITVYIDPANPVVPRDLGFDKIFGTIFASIGAIIMIIAIGILIYNIKQTQKTKKLLENGRHITAEIIHMDYDYQVTINGQHPLVFLCKDASGKVYKSGDIYNIQSYGIEIGTSVDVYVDYTNPDEYYVDIDRLLDPEKNMFAKGLNF